MIQRVQTLFLLATAILMVLILFFPIWGGHTSGAESFFVSLDAFELKQTDAQGGLIKSESAIYIAALALLSAITTFFTIFKFKNRKLQVTLCMLNLLIISGVIGCFFLAISKGQELLGAEKTEGFKIAFFLPIVALITTFLASNFIKKDEKLVRSMDRLR